LFPRPPKTCFPIAIATAEPITGIHHGTIGGKLNASSSPVTTALKSFIVTLCLLIFCIKASVPTAEPTDNATTKADWSPKK